MSGAMTGMTPSTMRTAHPSIRKGHPRARTVLAAQKTHNENPGVIKTGIVMVWMPITRNLLCWCRLRATPCCLGFILTQFEANESPPNSWQTIETSPCLSEPTTYLLKKYTSFRSAKTIIEHIGQQWFSGGLTESDPEVEVLFGMGEPSIVALKDECQKNLFLRLANQALLEKTNLRFIPLEKSVISITDCY